MTAVKLTVKSKSKHVKKQQKGTQIGKGSLARQATALEKQCVVKVTKNRNNLTRMREVRRHREILALRKRRSPAWARKVPEIEINPS